MLRHRSVLTLALLTLALPPTLARTLAQVRSAGTLRIATSADLPPFSYQVAAAPSGLEIDLGNALAAQLGVKPAWVVAPRSSLLGKLGSDQYDVVISSVTVTPDASKRVDFSDPYFCGGGAMLSREGGPLMTLDLENKRIAVAASTAYADYVRALSFTKTVHVYPNSSAAIQAFLTGKDDSLVTSKFVVRDIITHNSKGNLMMGNVLFQEQNAVAVQKGNASLQQAVNTALSALQRSGAFRTMSNKYFGLDVTCGSGN